MNFILERITQPDVEPITLAELKRHLRTFASATEEDEDLSNLIVSAREWVEDYTGRALIDQKWRLTIDDEKVFPATTTKSCSVGSFVVPSSGEILLRRAPVIEILSFVSVDALGAETAVAADKYLLKERDSKWPRLVPIGGADWSSGTFKIEFRAGYLDEDMIPLRFMQAMKLWAEANYDRDPSMMTLLIDTAERLIKPERSNLQIA